MPTVGKAPALHHRPDGHHANPGTTPKWGCVAPPPGAPSRRRCSGWRSWVGCVSPCNRAGLLEHCAVGHHAGRAALDRRARRAGTVARRLRALAPGGIEASSRPRGAGDPKGASLICTVGPYDGAEFRGHRLELNRESPRPRTPAAPPARCLPTGPAAPGWEALGAVRR